MSYHEGRVPPGDNQHHLAVFPLLLSGALLLGCGRTPAPPPTATLAPTPTAILTPTPTPLPGGLYVDAGQSLGAISPLVYGTKYGPWITVPYDLKQMADRAGITYLRFPEGICLLG